MRRIIHGGMMQLYRDVRKPLAPLRLRGEGDASANVDPVCVALVIKCHGPGRDVETRGADQSGDVGHEEAPDQIVVIADASRNLVIRREQ